MNRSCRTAFILTLPIITSQLGGQARRSTAKGPAAVQDGVAVYFSPGGGCTEAIVAEIGKAQKTIKLQAYSFTSVPIAAAVVDARKRGVQVTAILDKSQRTERYSSATFLNNQGVPVFIDARHAIAHNKIFLIDGKTIITGSFSLDGCRCPTADRFVADGLHDSAGGFLGLLDLENVCLDQLRPHEAYPSAEEVLVVLDDADGDPQGS